MDFMNSMAAMATSMSAARFQQSYSLSVVKKAMDSQESAVQQMMEMLPQQQAPLPASGSHIDVYA